MPEFTQQTFMGASIRFFRGSIGWGTNPSTVTVGLVEDPKNNDAFQAFQPGTPLTFSYGDWVFCGILQHWSKSYAPDGNPVYEVILEDPRQVLSGVQLILSGYNGTNYGVPNLLNIFGYLEDPNVNGFGGAGVSDAGIPWENVVQGVEELTAGENPGFGGQIALAGYKYVVDLSALPKLPSFFRVPSATISLMDFIGFVCEAANCDYFFNLEITPVANIISLGIVNRNIPPVFGAIDSFITNAQGASVKSAGFEFRNEVTSKFVVGGPVSEMLFQTPTASGGDSQFPENNAVWPYWGIDYNQNAIIGSGDGVYHSFAIPTRNANVFNLGDYYPSDVQELMAAYSGLSDWTQFLDFYNYNEWANNGYEFYNELLHYLGSSINGPLSDDDIKDATAVIVRGGNKSNDKTKDKYQEIPYLYPNKDGDWVKQMDSRQFLDSKQTPNPNYKKFPTYISMKRAKNPHYQKIHKLCPSLLNLTKVGIGYCKAEFFQYIAQLSPKRIAAMPPIETASPHDKNNISLLSKVKLPGVPDTEAENTDRLYDLVSTYAKAYMGQQFQITIPFVSAKVQPDTNPTNPTNIILSRQPDSSAFLDESLWDDAITNNYLPGNIDRMVDQSYKIRAYARYNDITGLDFSAIDDGNVVLSDNGKSAFVLCDVDAQAVFQDFSTQFSPRAIFKLPGPVFDLRHPNSHAYCNMMLQIFAGEMLRTFWGQDYTRARFQFHNQGAIQNSIKYIQDRLVANFGQVASTNISYQTAGMYRMPDLIALPLQSNIDQYGPWYAVGAQGQLSFEEDTNLVPWNFGGFDGMNQAGDAKVQSAISQYMVHEAGSIKIAGVPSITLGGALVESGPYVTDISVDVSDTVTTTYNMGTWVPHPYRMRKEYSEYVTKINRQLQDARHLLRVRSRAADKNASLVAGRLTDTLKDLTTPKPLHKTKHSPMVSILGCVDQVEDGVYVSTVAFDTDYGLASSLGDDVYETTCGGSLDTLFVPFSTSPDQTASGIPHFQAPTVPGSSGSPTADDLNPFTVGLDASGNVLSDVYFGSLVRDNEVPDSLAFDSARDDNIETDYIRAIALRTPMVLAGWGYDTAGNPTPSGLPNPDGSIPFASGYKVNMNDWRAGPLDVRWDDSRKVWAAGGDASLKLVKIVSDNTIGSGTVIPRVYKVQEYKATFDNTQGSPVTLTPLASGQGVQYVGNFRGNLVLGGSYYFAAKLGDKYFVDNQATFFEGMI